MDECKNSLHSQFPPRQDGAVGIAFAVALSTALLFTVLALDAGRLYWEGQELQRLADMAALDVANGSASLSAGLELDEHGQSELRTLARQSVTSNLPSVDWEVTTEAEQHGIVPPALGGARTSCLIGACPPNISTYDAVNVTVTRETCASIIVSLAALLSNAGIPSANDKCLTPTTAPLSRTATASRPMYTAFSAGATLLTLCTNDDNPQLLQAVLDHLLGSGLCAAVVSQAGIADLGISLLELRDGLALLRPDLALGSPSELLDARVTVAELTDAALNVLEANDPNALAEILNTEEIRLGDLLSLDPSSITSATALDTKIGVSDLISAGVLLANQQCVAGTGCYVNGIPISVDLGLVNLSVNVDLIQAPIIAIGPIGCANGTSAEGCTQWLTEARPAQLRVKSTVEINLPLVLSLSLDIDVTGAGATAGITSATRISEEGPSGTPSYDLIVGAILSPLTVDTRGNLTLEAVDLLDKIPALGTLVKGLLSILYNETLLSTRPATPGELQNLNLTPVKVIADSQDKNYSWPSEEAVKFQLGKLELDLLKSMQGATDGNINLISEVEKCVAILVCWTEERAPKISLGELLSSINDIQKPLTEIVSLQLFPLLEALGIGLNETEVRILDINTGGSATLVI